jgi:hypothetical protein
VFVALYGNINALKVKYPDPVFARFVTPFLQQSEYEKYQPVAGGTPVILINDDS